MRKYLQPAVAVCMCSGLDLVAAVFYVNVNNPSPAPFYTNWSTASVTIQAAVDVARPGDLVLVTNGVYSIGARPVIGTLSNRVVVNKAVRVQSVNGPEHTIIQGHQAPGTTNGDAAVRCVYLSTGASLLGFTLTNGATRQMGDPRREQSGGGLYCDSTNAVVSNCVLVGNSAFSWGGGAYQATLTDCTLRDNLTANDGGGAASSLLTRCVLTGNSAGGRGGGALDGALERCIIAGNSADEGGGAAGRAYPYTRGFPMLNNCLLVSNSASIRGGGAFAAGLTNCTLVGNSAISVGGASACVLRNSIIYYNQPNNVGDPYFTSSIAYCCTTPEAPSISIGNITNAPLFVNPAGGDFHLQPNSPCINAGNNAYVTNSTDLDGNPRILSGTVDIGAYEFQPASIACPPATTAECGSVVEVSATVSYPDGDALTIWWLVNGEVVQTNDLPATSPPGSTNVVLAADFPLGTNSVTVLVRDTGTNAVFCSTTVTVADTTPPVILSASANPSVLWPPNHQMVPVTVSARVSDNCGPASWKIIDVRSNESITRAGQGNTTADWIITGDHTVSLRAERSGTGVGRAYFLVLQARDESGNASDEKIATVYVQKNP